MPPRPTYGRRVLPALLALVLLPATGCRRSDAAAPPPKATVTVSRPLQREVVEWDQYTGHLAATDFVNLEARVSGQIVDVPFVEGSIVHKDGLLFQIDDRPFKADVDAKIAAVHSAEAQVQVANITLNRIKTAQPGAAVSQQELDQAVAALKTAQATQEGAEAALRNSQLNLDWCRVVAPITGRVSNKLVTVGNLVTGGSAGAGTLLTTITSVDPIYLYVDVDEASVLRYQRLAAEKKRISARDQRIPCFMQLGNEHNFPHAGVVDFVNNAFDPFTGTLHARGVFPNNAGTLLPGMYATMRIAGSGRYQALLIPAAAVQTQQNLKYVLTVDDKNTVKFTVVQPGALFGPLQAINSGIGPNDRIIVNGQLRARPDTQVDAEEQPIDPKLFELTAPGSPTTQELPQTRPFETPPGEMPPMSTIVPPQATTQPTTTTSPVTRPATSP